MKYVLPFACILSMILTSCQSKEALMWTDQPEIAAYAEVFNAKQKNFRIEIIYSQNPARELDEKQNHPDLVIGKWLTNSRSIKHFRSLEGLLKEKKIHEELFYPDILKLGKYQERRVLIPVSFNLPAIMFRKDNPDNPEGGVIIPIEILKDAGAKFNQMEKDRYKAIGFSPRWNTEFLYLFAQLSDVQFRASPNEKLIWDAKKLEDTVLLLRTWLQEANGGPAKEDVFNEKYLYDPPYKLLLNNRILFSYTNSKKYFELPEEKRYSLDFRWISKNDQIPVLDDVLYAGIPKRAKNPQAGEIFLQWLFDQENQKYLLEASAQKRVRTFGFARGFSTLVEVNERVFPKAYPIFVGHIPPAKYLKFPSQVSRNWQNLKDEVIKPWLYKQISSQAPLESIQETLDSWILQRSIN